MDRLLELVGQVCREFTGTSRFSAGDSYCLTFMEATLALGAAEKLAEEWSVFERETNGCSIKVVVHKGTLFTYRSYIYGNDLNVASAAEQATHNVEPVGFSVFVTEPVHRDLAGTPWVARLKLAEIQPRSRRLASIALYYLESRH